MSCWRPRTIHDKFILHLWRRLSNQRSWRVAWRCLRAIILRCYSAASQKHWDDLLRKSAPLASASWLTRTRRVSIECFYVWTLHKQSQSRGGLWVLKVFVECLYFPYNRCFLHPTPKFTTGHLAGGKNTNNSFQCLSVFQSLVPKRWCLPTNWN